MTPDFALQIVVALGGAAGVYAAIRADLARLTVIATQAQASAEAAHRRIDLFRNPNR
ncbi:hypothetical protein [Simplicispira suum]|uniref:hypothetical protein n=1 Tax=Simplicispira suum TaxID=2109915 RepID=UPI0014728B2A|nr:hypothetical protein [Simplicispira suum]